MKMKSTRPVKKKKKENTWAEAATEVLVRSKSKIMAAPEILEKIFEYKLKDIKLTKQAENVLKTMLAQSAAVDTCPFYKVGNKTDHTYSLKQSSHVQSCIKVDGTDGSDADSLSEVNEDSNGSGNSLRRSKRKASPLVDIISSTNESELKKSTSEKDLLSGITRRSNSLSGNAIRKAQLLSRRRTSSPIISPALSHPSSRNRSHLHTVHRSRSSNYVQKMSHSNANMKSRNSPLIDLETPSSVLTNTRLKSVINSAIFSMLPSSYQYQLVQLLPQVDQVIDEKGVPRMSPTALSNEFFSQALQDWVMHLSEGEFTRETQARIMQEIAKEKSKISPWKEKFFEEYYGQKQELKRTRSRSHDTASGRADLSFEAQLAKFQHLRDSIIEGQVKLEDSESNEHIAVVSDSESDQDPDYARPSMRPVIKSLPLKSINRRKINKPFKRPIMNSAGGYAQNTSMIHRKATMQHPSLYSQFGPNVPAKFIPSVVAHPVNFQIRDEFFPSDSEGSETGELSDSNSFHQHDDTDDEEDGESSDGMMNVGDNNLLDVDDSDSDEFEGNCFTADHSYTRMNRRRSSDDRDWRRPPHGLPSVMPVMSNENTKVPSSNQNTTLVLRPKGNLEQAVQAMNYSEDSSSTSPEQPYKRSFQDQPMFEKIVTVSKENTSKEERVGVLFGRGLQPMTANVYHGESIIPRISTTSVLMSIPITPTTVCTSTTSSRIMNESKPKSNIKPACHARSEAAVTPRSSNNNSNVSNRISVPDIKKGSIIPDVKSTETNSSSVKTVQSGCADTKNATLLAAEQSSNFQTKMEISNSSVKTDTVFKSLPVLDVRPNQIPNESTKTDICEARSKSPILKSPKRISNTSPTKSLNTDLTKVSPTVAPSQQGRKQPLQTLPPSPVKRTRTLAEIKAQMKAKKLAAAASASPSPGSSSSKSHSPVTKPALKLAQPVFCPNSSANDQSPATRVLDFASDASKASVAKKPSPDTPQSSTVASEKNMDDDCSGANLDSEKSKESLETLPKSSGKIILKIKSKEGNNYSVKVDNVTGKSSDSDEELLVRKNRRSSHVISSSDDSSDDFGRDKKETTVATRVTENYSMLSQLAIPGSYTGKIISIMETHPLKRTQKSPVFGEPAFEGLSMISNSVSPALSVTVVDNNSNLGAKSQPFVSDKPVIGFQDIPSCTALTSPNAPTFVQPSTTISAANDTQKYRSTSKGKSLVQMQQLARTNRLPSDESEMAESDTDSTVSTTTSAEEDDTNLQPLIGRANLRKRPTSDKTTEIPSKSSKLENKPHEERKEPGEGSDSEDSYSSSSNDEKPVITECICACKRLVLCKGCGAYTHEECLSSSKLCSLCVS